MTKRFLNLIFVLMCVILTVACKPPGAQCVEGEMGTDGCTGHDCVRVCGEDACFDADDWGYPRVKVPANSSGYEGGVSGSYPEQSVKAINSHQKILDVDKVPLVLSVGKYNKWTSWFNGDINLTSSGAPDFHGQDGGRVVPDRDCHYYSINGLSGGPGDDLSPATIWANENDNKTLYYRDNVESGVYESKKISGSAEPDPKTGYSMTAPCYYRDGMGLYLGLAPDNGAYKTTDKDVVLTYHIPDAVQPGVTKTELQNYSTNEGVAFPAPLAENNKDGYLVRGLAGDILPGAQSGDNLFFKIVDNYYDDNAGGYTVKIKEGTSYPYAGPFESVVNAVLDPVKVTMRRIYEGIVENSLFINTVRGALIIYIIAYAYIFMIGGIDEAKKNVIVRIFKIAIIVAVISPGSWDFFYNNFFSFFIDGASQIGAMLMNPFGGYDPHRPWYSMDEATRRFFSDAVQAKVWSTLFSNGFVGLFAVLALFFAIILFIISAIKAVMSYLVAMITFAILVILFPLMIVLILFETTSKLFEELWKQFLSISLEIIMLMASLGMFIMIIQYFMERNLGYTVCYNLLNFFPFHIDAGAHHWWGIPFWMPDIDINNMGNVWMDINGDGVRDVSPPEEAWRYLDMPYFDLVHDADKIDEYKRNVNFLSPMDVGMFVAATYLMYKFTQVVPQIAQSVKGGTAGASDQSSIFGLGGGKSGFAGALGASAGSVLGSLGKVADYASDDAATIMKTGGIKDTNAVRDLGGKWLFKSKAEMDKDAAGRVSKAPSSTYGKIKKGFGAAAGAASTVGSAFGAISGLGSGDSSGFRDSSSALRAQYNKSITSPDAFTEKGQHPAEDKAKRDAGDTPQSTPTETEGSDPNAVRPDAHEIKQQEFSLEEKMKADQKTREEREKQAKVDGLVHNARSRLKAKDLDQSEIRYIKSLLANEPEALKQVEQDISAAEKNLKDNGGSSGGGGTPRGGV